MKQFSLYILTIVVLLSCNRCKDKECTDSTNPECPNYVAPVDPCAGKHEVSADFSIYQQGNIIGLAADTLVELRTEVLSNRTIHLHASESDANYTWVIGSDTIHSRDYAFSMGGSSFDGQWINIKLIVQKEIDSLCFPNDNGLDTLVRPIHVKSRCETSFFGTWKGSWTSAPQDSFYVDIISVSSGTQAGPCDHIDLKGLDGIYTNETPCDILSWTNNYLDFTLTLWLYHGPEGKLFYDEVTDEIQVRYTILEEPVFPSPRIFKVFNGRRVQ